MPNAVADVVNNFYMVALPNSSTCRELLDAVQQYETGLEECAQSEVHELYCFPTTPDIIASSDQMEQLWQWAMNIKCRDRANVWFKIVLWGTD